MTITIKLMPDYECHPLWGVVAGQFAELDPKILPIGESTKGRLQRWAETYDATLNRGNPAESGFKSPEDEQAFDREGLELWKVLRSELGPDYEVIYFSELLGREVQPEV